MSSEPQLEFERLEVEATSADGRSYIKAFRGLWLFAPSLDKPGLAVTARGSFVVVDRWGYFEVYGDLEGADDEGLVCEEQLLEVHLELLQISGHHSPVVLELDI